MSTPAAVAKSLHLRTDAAIYFIRRSIAELQKALRERPDLADTAQYKNAARDLDTLKRLMTKEQF